MKKALIHGTRSGYTNYRCRCVPCCEANRDYQRQWMAEDKERKWGTEPRQHGTLRGYQHYGCRCDVCRQANTDYYRNLRRHQPGKVISFAGAPL